MYKSSANNGVFLGIALVVCMFGLYVANQNMFFASKGWVYFLVFLLILRKSGLEARMQNGGYISFGQVFKNMFYTGAIGYLISTFGEYFLYNFIDRDLIEIHRELSIQSLELMSEFIENDFILDNIDKEIENLEDNNPLSGQRLIMQYMQKLIAPIAFFSAILALFMRRKGPDELNKKNDQRRYIVNND